MERILNRRGLKNWKYFLISRIYVPHEATLTYLDFTYLGPLLCVIVIFGYQITTSGKKWFTKILKHIPISFNTRNTCGKVAREISRVFEIIWLLNGIFIIFLNSAQNLQIFTSFAKLNDTSDKSLLKCTSAYSNL